MPEMVVGEFKKWVRDLRTWPGRVPETLCFIATYEIPRGTASIHKTMMENFPVPHAFSFSDLIPLLHKLTLLSLKSVLKEIGSIFIFRGVDD